MAVETYLESSDSFEKRKVFIFDQLSRIQGFNLLAGLVDSACNVDTRCRCSKGFGNIDG